MTFFPWLLTFFWNSLIKRKALIKRYESKIFSLIEDFLLIIDFHTQSFNQKKDLIKQWKSELFYRVFFYCFTDKNCYKIWNFNTFIIACFIMIFSWLSEYQFECVFLLVGFSDDPFEWVSALIRLSTGC